MSTLPDPTPPLRIVGYQRWRKLLFLHWRVDPQVLQQTLPPDLTIETFDGWAWLAVVPFSMEAVRPWWSPAVPGISWFLETNVRTYVRHRNGQSAVWFYSLDANQRLAVQVARRFWHLNYRAAQLRLESRRQERRYSGELNDGTARYDITATLAPDRSSRVAGPGSLEEFLLERYHLLAQRPDRQFLVGQVHHAPYEWVPVEELTVTQTLTDAIGLPIHRTPDHAAYSTGVDVRVSPLQLVESPQ